MHMASLQPCHSPACNTRSNARHAPHACGVNADMHSVLAGLPGPAGEAAGAAGSPACCQEAIPCHATGARAARGQPAASSHATARCWRAHARCTGCAQCWCHAAQQVTLAARGRMHCRTLLLQRPRAHECAHVCMPPTPMNMYNETGAAKKRVQLPVPVAQVFQQKPLQPRARWQAAQPMAVPTTSCCAAAWQPFQTQHPCPSVLALTTLHACDHNASTLTALCVTHKPPLYGMHRPPTGIRGWH
jgi:hypothetical protein